LRHLRDDHGMPFTGIALAINALMRPVRRAMPRAGQNRSEVELFGQTDALDLAGGAFGDLGDERVNLIAVGVFAHATVRSSPNV
jgi:hypothetical protein